MNTETWPIKSKITTESVARFVTEKINPDSPLEHALRKETRALAHGGMISSSDVGSFLQILVQSIGASQAIEVGTFTGYTALKIASALPTGGKLICCDIDPETSAIAKRHWHKAGLNEKIDLRLAPAGDTLNALLSAGGKGRYDFAFIDADKSGYAAYFELCLELLRPGGLIVLDNMLWDGMVADPSCEDATTQLLRDLDLKISRDPRVSSVLLTVGDGLMLVRKL